MMFRLPTGFLSLSDFPSEGASRLTGAVMLSVAAHGLLLAWPVSLPVGGTTDIVAERAAKPRPLRVSLRLAAESAAPAPADTPVAAPMDQASIAPAQEDSNRDAPPKERPDPKAVPLVGYYPADRLTKMPQAVGIFDIQPPAGGDTGLGGKVTVRIWIGANGAIDRARVLSSGLPESYVEAAVAAFEKLRFEPGEIGGVPVKSWVEIVIEYTDFRDDPPQAAR